jgi:cyanophycinase-like exopeptidase
MGSGETAPTMVTTHREIVARLGPSPPRAVLLDTPYGFQENAPELSHRTVEHFGHRVQLAVEVVGFPGPLAVEPADRSPQPTPAALARLRAAAFVFAGPGSPSYALAAWRPSPVPAALIDKLAHGGAVVFSSAAAVTAGRFSLPVYEIYKAGQPLAWLDGLDLLAAAGLPPDAVAIPHFDNAEGGTHDTRFCYMGERRLAALEALLPDTAWVLGIDEHTALVLDLSAGTASVTGRGTVTVRRRGAVRRLSAGTRLSVRELGAVAHGLRTGEPARTTPAETGSTGTSAPGVDRAAPGESPLLAEAARLEAAFASAIAAGKAEEATGAILALDRAIDEWSADSLQSEDPDRARAVLHALVHRLGEAAAAGLQDPRERLAPLVEGLIALRAELRAERAWALADRLRDRLTAAGVDLRDTPAGPVWSLRPPDALSR